LTYTPSKTIFIGAAAGLALAAAATNALAQPAAQARPQLPIPTAQSIKASCDKNLATVRAKFRAIESGKFDAAKGERDVYAAMNSLNMLIEDLSGPLYIIANVSPDKATRDAAEDCTVKYSPLETEIYQSERLFKRIKAAKPATPEQTVYQKDLIEGFEDSGVALPADKRKRAREITEQITKLAKDFERNVREDGTRVSFTAEDLKGVPQSVIDGAKKLPDGKLSLGLDYPSYLPVMENAVREATREAMWRAKSSEGGAQNLALLDQITALRQELAALYGYPNYAAFTLRRKMARTPENVMKFLEEVKGRVTELEKSELAQLRALKSEMDKTPLEQTTVRRWDNAFLQQQLKKTRYNVDQEAMRKYFPTEASVQYTLKLSALLYGIKFTPRTVPTWHEDVRFLDVSDAASGKFIGSVYMDLFPRENKYNHAAVWPVRNASTLVGRTPIPVLVTNLNRNGLTQDELETLLHEFGHALHGVLSVAKYNAHAGTSVLRDFVEAPSQMFEEWARREEPLKFFAQVCGDCPVLSREQIAQLDSARKFGRGIGYARQWVYASYDMALTYGRTDKSAMDAWKRIEGATPLGYVEGSMFPASFGHLVGGYAAGYYGYMWSEVLALDMLSAFGGKLLNQEVGRNYRNLILAQGGQKPPHLLVESFLGRAANSEAFFKEITGQR
jgi:thimet oligopeptidase